MEKFREYTQELADSLILVTAQNVHFSARFYLRAPQNGHASFSEMFSLILNLNSLVKNLLFQFCTGPIFIKKIYSCGLKYVPVLCLFYFKFF